MPKGPAKGTQIKNGRYYRVAIQGKKRVWIPLTRVDAGLPAFYAALASELGRKLHGDAMPKLVAEWEAEIMSTHAPKTQIDEKRRARVIAESFADLLASEVETPDCYQFLQPFSEMKRTYNLFRQQLRSIFKLAELKGYRKAGSNPISSISTMSCAPRSRYITDSELRRIKMGCFYGDDGRVNPSGLTMVCLLEILYLTGADVGVVTQLREQRDSHAPDAPHVCNDGLFLRREKTEGTSRPVIVEWTPRLRAVVARLLKLKKERLLKRRADQRVVTPFLFTEVDGTPLTYEAVSAAWQRGRDRAKVPAAMIRDLRAKAATDKEEREGLSAANALLDHTTEQQTADYVRRKKARRTTAVR